MMQPLGEMFQHESAQMYKSINGIAFLQVAAQMVAQMYKVVPPYRGLPRCIRLFLPTGGCPDV